MSEQTEKMVRDAIAAFPKNPPPFYRYTRFGLLVVYKNTFGARRFFLREWWKVKLGGEHVGNKLFWKIIKTKD